MQRTQFPAERTGQKAPVTLLSRSEEPALSEAEWDLSSRGMYYPDDCTEQRGVVKLLNAMDHTQKSDFFAAHRITKIYTDFYTDFIVNTQNFPTTRRNES